MTERWNVLRAFDAIFAACDLTAQEKLVAAVLAWRTNATTGTCHPSLARIVADTGLARATVARALRSLAERSEGAVGLEWTSGGGSSEGRAARANTYRLTVTPSQGETGTVSERDRLRARPSHGDTVSG